MDVFKKLKQQKKHATSAAIENGVGAYARAFDRFESAIELVKFAMPDDETRTSIIAEIHGAWAAINECVPPVFRTEYMARRASRTEQVTKARHNKSLMPTRT